MSRSRHPQVTPRAGYHPVIDWPLNLAIDAALDLTHLVGRACIALPPSGGTRRTRNVRYGPEPRHRLDIYTPREPRDLHVLFVHGGSFRRCSKESHQFVAHTLASLGLHVYIIDYGLAPRHRYPTAHHDAYLAYRWLARGPGRGHPLVPAGDSAGANIALSIAVSRLARRPSDIPPMLRDTPMPRAVICGSGLFRVRGRAHAYRDAPVARARLMQIERDYLGPAVDPWLAEPLAALSAATLDRETTPLPPVFIAVGERDPIGRDSEQLAEALPAGHHRTVRYPGQGHAFMVTPLSTAATRCWRDALEFLLALPETGDRP